MAISYRRLALIAVTVSLIATCFTLVPPLAQDPRYHAFADGRTLHGVPNFWNVISNVPFLLVALYGIKSLRLLVAEAFFVGQTGYSQPIPKAGIGGSPRFAARAFIEPWERIACCLLLAGTAAVGVGSTYYHLHPDDARLGWDRLPMTVVFMSLVAATIGERVSMKAGRLLLPPMILLGLGAVLYWRYSGDLRPYCIVQFGSILAMPLMLARFPPRYSAGGCLWGTVVLYALAKLVELLDHEIASCLATGGHPWKHLFAAGAILLYVSSIARRRPLADTADDTWAAAVALAPLRQGATQ